MTKSFQPFLTVCAAAVLALSTFSAEAAKPAKKPAAKAAAKPAAKAAPATKQLSSGEILAAASASDWRDIDPKNSLMIELEGNAMVSVPPATNPDGSPLPDARVEMRPANPVIIELAADFAPKHAANIGELVRAGYFDKLAIIRVQDNYVTQWGDAEDDPAKAKAKPATLVKAPVEFDRPLKGLTFTKLPEPDGWAPQAGFVNGWPVAADPKTGRAWLTHCYSMVGAARGNESDSSDGSGLYTVIGHAPRALDLNITNVGRVVMGMERLSALPRGTGTLGFYVKPEERTVIQRVRMLADVPEAERPKLQILRTDTDTFRRWLDSRRFRSGWFVHSPDRVDLCSAMPPTRRLP